MVTIEVFRFGWKVIVLMDIRTRIPLAAKVVKIQEYEGVYLLPLLRQAQANLGEYARIGKVVADRIYLDGEDLWELNQMGIIFVVIAKDCYLHHLVPGRAPTTEEVLGLVYLAALGMLLGAVFAKTGSLLPSFLIHAINNFSL